MRILLVALVVVAGCGKKKDAPEMMAVPGTSGAMGPEAEMGSAMRGSGSAMPAMPIDAAAPIAATPKTPDELAKRYAECWSFYNASRWDDYKTCYAAGAIFELPGLGSPQLDIEASIAETTRQRADFPDDRGELELVLVSDQTIVGIARVTGTSSGASKTVPAGKHVGVYLAQAVKYDAAGQVTRDTAYFDAATMMAQVGVSKIAARPVADKARPKVVVLSAAGVTETNNAAAIGNLVEAVNKHDPKAIAELVADDAVWSEQALDKDLDKKGLAAHLAALWKGFSNWKLDVRTTTTAGDYVASQGTLEGTNDGDYAAMQIKKTGKNIAVPYLAIYKLDNGKVKAAWVFWQRAAITAQLGLDQPPPAKGSASSDPLRDRK